jgi:hypothetical protein
VRDLKAKLVCLQSWRSLNLPDLHLKDPRDTLVVQIAPRRNKCLPTRRLMTMIRPQGLNLGRERKALSCHLAFGPEQNIPRPVQTILLVE